jgi:hypothetical protein
MVVGIFDSPLEAVGKYGNETGETGANLWITGAEKRESTTHSSITFLMVNERNWTSKILFFVYPEKRPFVRTFNYLKMATITVV